MSKSWMIVAATVFLLTFVAIAFLASRNLAERPPTGADPNACTDCGAEDSVSRFGKGKIPGETVLIPATPSGSPLVAISFKAGCTYCLVTAVTTALAATAFDEVMCPNLQTLSLALIAHTDEDLGAARQLQFTLSSLLPSSVTSFVDGDTRAWNEVFGTDIVPTTIVLDQQSRVIGQ